MGVGSVSVGDDEGADFVDMFAALGAPKKEVKLASFLGFFKSKDEAVGGSALRFTADICLMELNGIQNTKAAYKIDKVALPEVINASARDLWSGSGSRQILRLGLNEGCIRREKTGKYCIRPEMSVNNDKTYVLSNVPMCYKYHPDPISTINSPGQAKTR